MSMYGTRISITENNLAFAIPAGLIDGMSSVNKFGRSLNADSGIATDVWDGANATDDIDIWVAPTAARIHNIVSSSDQDSATGGSVAQGNGAWTLKLYGLTGWGASEVSETVTLDGTGGVNTVNSYVIIYRMKVLTTGGTSVNAGYIDAVAATNGTITAMIRPNEGQTQMAIFGIPSTQSLYLTKLYSSVLKGTNKTVAVNMSLLWTPEVATNEAIFQVKHTSGYYYDGSTIFSHSFNPYNKFAGPGILKLQTVTDQADADISGGFDVIVVDN